MTPSRRGTSAAMRAAAKRAAMEMAEGATMDAQAQKNAAEDANTLEQGVAEGETVNATRQTEDSALAWADVQKKIWDYWSKGVESGSKPPYLESWERASASVLDACAGSVKLALQTQLDSTAAWTKRLSEDDKTPKEVVEWARQTYDMMKAWSDAQLELWDSWFSSLKKLQPLDYSNAYTDVAKSWREATRKSLDAEAEWLRVWAQRATANGQG